MSKKIVLIGPLTKILPNIDADYAGIDAGSLICYKKNRTMVFAIGDFDSINKEEYVDINNSTKCIKLNEHKNETDSEAAVIYATKLGYDEIILYGVLGGRIDHEYANLRLLSEYDYNLVIMNETNYITILKEGRYKVDKLYNYLSFFAVDDACISLSGVAYPLDKRNIKRKDIYCCSNEILEEAIIDIHSGEVIMIQCNDGKG
ncbi:MAG: thiamine diphosphokinase [Erysipelotrichaceae bacterium]